MESPGECVRIYLRNCAIEMFQPIIAFKESLDRREVCINLTIPDRDVLQRERENSAIACCQLNRKTSPLII